MTDAPPEVLPLHHASSLAGDDDTPVLTRAQLASAIKTVSTPPHEHAGGPTAPRASTPRDCLVVGPGARWFRINDGPTVSLGRRRPLRRLLLTLARAVATNSPIPTAGLATAGWPKETLSPATGSGRVRRTIATLRQLGLRALLVKGPRGYELDAVILIETQIDPGKIPLISGIPASTAESPASSPG